MPGRTHPHAFSPSRCQRCGVARAFRVHAPSDWCGLRGGGAVRTRKRGLEVTLTIMRAVESQLDARTAEMLRRRLAQGVEVVWRRPPPK